MNENIKKLLELAVTNKASDVHLAVGMTPKLRVGGKLVEVAGYDRMEKEKMETVMMSFLDEGKRKKVELGKEVDFSFSMVGARFRVNVYRQSDLLAAAFRVIPDKIPDFVALGLPSIFNSLVGVRQGFVLVTGPTGHGKSTTVASVLNQIAQTRTCHIVTIEDPVEYLIDSGKSIVSQREVGTDTKTFASALRSVLRQDPDVVFIGEMRDLETISSALTVAETGHLVFSTLHTNSAAQTVDRIVDVFPEGEKEQVRLQLASTITAVVSERLVPTRDGKVVAAFEVMMGTTAVKNVIREGKTHLINNIIQTSAEAGMMTLEASLAKLVKSGQVDEEMAMSFCLRPSDLQVSLRKKDGIYE